MFYYILLFCTILYVVLYYCITFYVVINFVLYYILYHLDYAFCFIVIEIRLLYHFMTLKFYYL